MLSSRPPGHPYTHFIKLASYTGVGLTQAEHVVVLASTKGVLAGHVVTLLPVIILKSRI